MNENTQNFALDRRSFVLAAGASAISVAGSPLKMAFAGGNKDLLWAGLNFMRACPVGPKGVECSRLDETFPNIIPILNDQKKAQKLYNTLPGKWGAPVGVQKGYRLIWPTMENTEVGETDLGVFIGITSDRDIANKYYPKYDTTVLVYELQTYLFVFDVENFEIIQSHPMRIWSYDIEKGEKKGESKALSLQSKMWRSLGGTKAPSGTGKYLPELIQNRLKKVDFSNMERVNLRVTDVSAKAFSQKWVKKQGKEVSDFQAILGNSLTNAVSENMGIGIQPYSSARALAQLTNTFAAVSEKSALLHAKLLNTAPIELDLRIVSRGMRVTEKKVEGYEKVFDRRTLISVFLEAGRWKRTYGDEQRLIVESEELETLVFRQKLNAIAIERTTGTWSNDWFWVLDLHQRLFDWFFAELFKGNNYSGMARGKQEAHKSRKFLTRVVAKEFGAFEKEAKALRAVLLKKTAQG